MKSRQAIMAGVLCMLAVSLIPTSPASSLDQAEKFANIRAGMFKEELSLNNEQAAAIEKICHEAFLQMQEISAGLDPVKDSQAMVQQLLNLLQRRNADLQKVLTAGQLTLYQEHKPERLAELVTEVLMMQLSLSESQAGQVHDTNLKTFESIQGYMPVLEDGSKTKKRRADKSVKTLLQSRDETFKGIFSTEQWNAYENYKDAIDELYGE